MTTFSESNRKTALITGASRGLGFVIAETLAKTGHNVIITARNQDELTQAANTLRKHTTVTAVTGDVTDAHHQQQLELLCAGGLDVLVHNASDLGVSPLPPLASYDLARFEGVWRTNVLAPLALTQRLLAALSARQGLLVHVSSDAALGAYEGWGAYGASKAALDLLSQTLAKELRAAGVGVVSVDPGDMRTRMHQQAFPGEDISDRPLPDMTVPFWLWLFGQPPLSVSGQRFLAQGDLWLRNDAPQGLQKEQA